MGATGGVAEAPGGGPGEGFGDGSAWSIAELWEGWLELELCLLFAVFNGWYFQWLQEGVRQKCSRGFRTVAVVGDLGHFMAPSPNPSFGG